MAKYTRYDPRNKKRHRHKNQYLDRSPRKNKRDQFFEYDISEQDMSKIIKDYR